MLCLLLERFPGAPDWEVSEGDNSEVDTDSEDVGDSEEEEFTENLFEKSTRCVD